METPPHYKESWNNLVGLFSGSPSPIYLFLLYSPDFVHFSLSLVSWPQSNVHHILLELFIDISCVYSGFFLSCC